jgi:SAM-dependent MidA family methyltransferase
MNNKKVIQPFVSRFESYKNILSDYSWERGVSNFFLEKIPFSFSTGSFWATKVTQLLEELTSDTKEDCHSYEWGAGLGILSKQVLDILKETNIDLYNRTLLHISDFSEALISELASRNVFCGHEKAYDFMVNDITKPKLYKDIKAQFMYLTYLLTSLPTRHIEVEDGVIYEIQVQTTINPRATILDTTTYPPKTLNAKAIKEMFTIDNKEKLILLCSKISPILFETPKRIPIQKINNFIAEEHNDLTDFVETLDTKNKCIRFNYSFYINKAITKLLDSLSETGAILIYDFGFTDAYKHREFSDLNLHLGIAYAFPIFAPYIEYLCKKNNSHCYINSFAEGQDQIMVIGKNNNIKKISSKIFSNAFGSNEISVINKILSHPEPDKVSLSQIESILAKLIESERDSFYILSSLGSYYLKIKRYDLAKHFINKTLNTYSSIAISSYMILGQIALKEENLTLAKDYFNKVTLISPYYPEAYNHLSIVNAKENNFSEFLRLAKLFIRYSIDDDIEHHLKAIGLIESKLKN